MPDGFLFLPLSLDCSNLYNLLFILLRKNFAILCVPIDFWPENFFRLLFLALSKAFLSFYLFSWHVVASISSFQSLSVGSTHSKSLS